MRVSRVARTGALVVLLAALGAGAASAATHAKPKKKKAAPAWPTAKLDCAKLVPVTQASALSGYALGSVVHQYAAGTGALHCQYQQAAGGPAPIHIYVWMLNAKQKAKDAATVAAWQKSSSTALSQPFGAHSWLTNACALAETRTESVLTCLIANQDPGAPAPSDADPELAFMRTVMSHLH